MTEPTDADRKHAAELAMDLPGLDYDDDGVSWRRQVEFLAGALADERARATRVLAEWHCPSCGATTRARMADQ